MFDIALYQPEIPPNTGNIIRLCANTGARLHIIQPAAFSLDDKRLQRAGLDYHEFAHIGLYPSYGDFMANRDRERTFAISTKGSVCYADVTYQAGDTFLFGPETRGLPADIREEFEPDRVLYLPMLEHSRSLNLSNTVSILLYEAWRQCGFAGAKSRT